MMFPFFFVLLDEAFAPLANVGVGLVLLGLGNPYLFRTIFSALLNMFFKEALGFWLPTKLTTLPT